jgi:hypothetical protein
MNKKKDTIEKSRGRSRSLSYDAKHKNNNNDNDIIFSPIIVNKTLKLVRKSAGRGRSRSPAQMFKSLFKNRTSSSCSPFRKQNMREDSDSFKETKTPKNTPISSHNVSPRDSQNSPLNMSRVLINQQKSCNFQNSPVNMLRVLNNPRNSPRASSRTSSPITSRMNTPKYEIRSLVNKSTDNIMAEIDFRKLFDDNDATKSFNDKLFLKCIDGLYTDYDMILYATTELSIDFLEFCKTRHCLEIVTFLLMYKILVKITEFDEFVEKARDIYDKLIGPKSEKQLNLKSSTLQNINNVLDMIDDVKRDKIIEVYFDVCEEVSKLIKDDVMRDFVAFKNYNACE